MADKYVAYVGTYTHTKSKGIYVYDVNPETGVMTERSVTPINNPSNLTVSHSGKFLYSIADEGVAAFSIDENGDLTKINQEWIGGMRGCYVRCDSQDRYLFVAGFHDGRVTMMKLNEDGSIGGISDGIFHQGVGKSLAEMRLDPHVTCVELTPDEKFLCAVDVGLHQVKVYEVDYENGKLHLADILRCEINSGPRMLRFSSSGRFAYVMTESSNEIIVYHYTKRENGAPDFEKLQTVSMLHGMKDEVASGTNLKGSKDGRFVLASLDGINAMVIYKRDKETGLLEYMAHNYISGDFPKSFAMIPGDKYFVSLNHDSDEMTTFVIDYETGHCLMQNKPIKITKPNCILVHKL